MRLIHTADWQLGKPFGRMAPETRIALDEARLNVIDAIANLARDEGVGHVIVAGDAFDNPEPGDRLLAQALTRMASASCRWWLLPGNHDYARAEGLWSRLVRDAPANVTALLEPAPVEIDPDSWLLPAPLLHRRTTGDPTAALDGMATPDLPRPRLPRRAGPPAGPLNRYRCAANP